MPSPLALQPPGACPPGLPPSALQSVFLLLGQALLLLAHLLTLLLHLQPAVLHFPLVFELYRASPPRWLAASDSSANTQSWKSLKEFQ